MDKFKAMQVFIRVVDTNSFSMAADALDLPLTTVTDTLQHLETELGVSLLQRTTRKLKLTEDGAEYYERSRRLLAGVEELESSLSFSRPTPRGKLRVDVPAWLAARLVIPALPDFRSRYPDIELTMRSSDHSVELAQDGVDCAIRGGELEDLTLAARRIGGYRMLTCATPAYLTRHGTPQTIAELADHRAVNHYVVHSGRIRPFSYQADGKTVAVKMASAVNIGDADALLQCGLQGLGLFQAADFVVQPHLQSGQLLEVLQPWRPLPVPLSAVYPQDGELPQRVRLFIDWIAELTATTAV